MECLFADWWAFRRGELDRPGLHTWLDLIACKLQGVLEQGRSCAGFQGNHLLGQPPGTLSGVVVVQVHGVELTNNRNASYAWAGGRCKNAFSCHSPAAC